MSNAMEQTGNSLVQCIYSSASPEPIDAERLTEILSAARKNNAKLGITGMLLYERQSFFQILEGPEQSVNQLYRKIARDNRHTQITKILFQPISERVFDRWSMGYVGVSMKELASVKGLNDFFRSGQCYNDLDESRAKLLLAAFKEGKWHAKIQ